MKLFVGKKIDTPNIFTYDLPARFRGRTALVIAVAFLFTPNGPSLPISPIIAVGTIIYFSLYSSGINELGLNLNIRRSAKKALIIIAVVTSLILLASLFLINYAKDDMLQHAGESQEELAQTGFEFIGSWAPDKSIHQSLSSRDIGQVSVYSIKPIIGFVFFAPVFETTIIFGMVFPVVWRRYGYKKALWLTPMFFATLHILNTSLIGFFIIYLNGLFQAMLYAKTKSIYPSNIFHMCWNLNIYLFHIMMNWSLPYYPAGG